MAGFRIASQGINGPAPTSPVKRPTYRAFIAKLPCIISKHSPVQVAHLSAPSIPYGHTGRGKSQKADDSWCLPLRPDLHEAQHRMNEMRFWAQHKIDPHAACLIIFGIYNRLYPDEAEASVRRMILADMFREGSRV